MNSEKYRVVVNDQLEFEMTPEDLVNLDIFALDSTQKHVLNSDQSHLVSFAIKDFLNRSYHFELDGQFHKVKIHSPLEQRIEKMGLGHKRAEQFNSVAAPMPGVVLELRIAEGQEVEKGDTLLILEAMKMENALVSPKKAKIKSIHVQEKDTVEKSKVLIELE